MPAEPKSFVYLTPAERKAVDLSAQLAKIFKQDILGSGRTRNSDEAEFVSKIHDIQRMILAQAASRVYPDDYRLLGE